MASGVIRGRVVARDGTPLPHAEVFALGSGWRARTQSDGAGEFRVEVGGPVGRVSARVHGWASREPVVVGVDADEVIADVVLTLDSAFVIAGQVVSGERGVANIEVSAGIVTPFAPCATVTDDDGRFELHGIKPGFLSVYARRGDWASEADVEVADRDVLDVRIELPVGEDLGLRGAGGERAHRRGRVGRSREPWRPRA